MQPICRLSAQIAYTTILLLIGSAALAAGDDVSGYGIQPGDVLSISVWGEPELQREVLVRPDGEISFPLVGTLPAAGLGISTLTENIAEQLDRFVPEPAVTISVLQMNGNRIYVLGRVNRPGEFVVLRRVSVLQALAMAGGLTPYAERKDIRILRGQGEDQLAMRFDYSAVERGEALGQNITLQPGDVVVVP
jgi:polysaccharide export outer membrane protein